MNKQIKLFLGVVVLIAIIAGSAGLYQTLGKNYTPNTQLKPIAGEEETSSGEPDVTSEPELMLAPDFSVEDTEGNTVKLSDFIGKPVVINFWASWCPPCKAEMPDFEKVFGELGDEVSFLMINATDGGRETKEKAQDFLADQEFSFPVYYDLTQEAVYTYGISSLPTTLFIDKDGYLITGAMGMIDEDALREGIELILP